MQGENLKLYQRREKMEDCQSEDMYPYLFISLALSLI